MPIQYIPSDQHAPSHTDYGTFNSSTNSDMASINDDGLLRNVESKSLERDRDSLSNYFTTDGTDNNNIDDSYKVRNTSSSSWLHTSVQDDLQQEALPHYQHQQASEQFPMPDGLRHHPTVYSRSDIFPNIDQQTVEKALETDSASTVSLSSNSNLQQQQQQQQASSSWASDEFANSEGDSNSTSGSNKSLPQKIGEWVTDKLHEVKESAVALSEKISTKTEDLAHRNMQEANADAKPGDAVVGLPWQRGKF